MCTTSLVMMSILVIFAGYNCCSCIAVFGPTLSINWIGFLLLINILRTEVEVQDLKKKRRPSPSLWRVVPCGG